MSVEEVMKQIELFREASNKIQHEFKDYFLLRRSIKVKLAELARKEKMEESDDPTILHYLISMMAHGMDRSCEEFLKEWFWDLPMFKEACAEKKSEHHEHAMQEALKNMMLAAEKESVPTH